MVDEARLERIGAGMTPVSDGWFVVNVRDAAWVTSPAFGADCIVEGDAVFAAISHVKAALQRRP